LLGTALVAALLALVVVIILALPALALFLVLVVLVVAFVVASLRLTLFLGTRSPVVVFLPRASGEVQQSLEHVAGQLACVELDDDPFLVVLAFARPLLVLLIGLARPGDAQPREDGCSAEYWPTPRPSVHESVPLRRQDDEVLPVLFWRETTTGVGGDEP